MNRSHVLAALVGSASALGVVVLLSMSEVMPAGQHVLVGYEPNPRDMVQINEGTQYVVPGGKLFVLTALGRTQNGSGSGVRLTVNGVTEFTQGSSSGSIGESPQGFTIAAGKTIEVQDTIYTGNLGRAWGFLASE
jgi:hypothetical protein